MVWMKRRNASSSHALYDVLRGALKRLIPDLTDAEDAADANSLTAFDSNGFSLGNQSHVNLSGGTFVAWNWKAGGTGSANTDGSISSTVSVNTEAGFSIVSYTGNGAAGATVGHGLSKTPDLVIMKDRSDNSVNDNWFVTSSGLTNTTTYSISLNGTYAESNVGGATSYGGGLALTSASVVTPISGTVDNRTSNESGDNYIAYCFHNVEGYSKFGKYIANANSDGPFVYTGFRPRFIIFKGMDAATNWAMIDTVREPYNPSVKESPYTDANVAESGTTYYKDILSNGFKIRITTGGFNTGSGADYLYMAFAENPFKYTTAR